MTGPIQSVTVAVAALERSRRLFEERLGLTQVSDGRASVGLLSAWRYPVHESVRLVELAHRGEKFGHVRLALYEDASCQTARGEAHPAPQLSSGPCVLDFGAASAELGGKLLEADDGAPLIIQEPSQHASGGVGSVWVLGAATPLARRFYTEALGYRISEERDATVDEDAEFFERLGIGRGSRLQLTRLVGEASPRGGILLIELLDRKLTARPPRLGAAGINLLTCKCADLDELIERLKAFDTAPLAAPSHVGLPDGSPARVMVVHGPSGEAFEFVEIEA